MTYAIIDYIEEMGEKMIQETLKKIREKLNLTQEDAAREVNVTFATWNRWERGHFQPSRLAFEKLQALADRARVKLSPPNRLTKEKGT